MIETLPDDVIENIRIAREDAAGEANYAYRFQRATIILADALERQNIHIAQLEQRERDLLTAIRIDEALLQNAGYTLKETL